MADPGFDPPLLYARCWEDHAVLRRGLRIQPGDHVLSIGSAGDNGFALLLDDPASVTVLDRNQTQLALVRLKIACLTELEPRDARRFLGSEDAPAAERRRRLRQLAPLLSETDRARWQSSLPVIERGILNGGKFERYLDTFRRVVLPLVQRRATVRAMVSLSDLGAQRRLYAERWDSPRWRLAFRVFFGRRVMERIGRERAFFDHVEERSVGDVFRARARRALCDLPVACNPFLTWILTRRELPPPYLDDACVPTIRARLSRLRLVEDDLGDHLAGAPQSHYAAHNLSDCFEYLTQERTDEILAALVRASQPGARLVYWNLLVPRDGQNLPAIVPEEDLAKRLHASDRAFFYGRLVVERVRESDQEPHNCAGEE